MFNLLSRRFYKIYLSKWILCFFGFEPSIAWTIYSASSHSSKKGIRHSRKQKRVELSAPNSTSVWINVTIKYSVQTSEAQVKWIHIKNWTTLRQWTQCVRSYFIPSNLASHVNFQSQLMNIWKCGKMNRKDKYQQDKINKLLGAARSACMFQVLKSPIYVDKQTFYASFGRSF